MQATPAGSFVAGPNTGFEIIVPGRQDKAFGLHDPVRWSAHLLAGRLRRLTFVT